MLLPWMNHATGRRAPLNDGSFLRWVTALADAPTRGWLSERRQGQARDWVHMYRAQANVESACYYKPNDPVAFGLFMFLPMAALHVGRTPLELFDTFARFTRLDQGHAGTGTGLFASLLTQAITQDPIGTPAQVAEWFQATAAKTIEQIEALHNASQAEQAGRYRMGMEYARRFAEDNHALSGYEFACAFSKWIAEANWCPGRTHPAGGCNDPLTFWVQFHGALQYAGGEVNATLRLLAAMSGDCDTAAMLAGTLLGGLLGYNQLPSIAGGGPVDLNTLNEMDANLHEYFGYTCSEAAEAFTPLLP